MKAGFIQFSPIFGDIGRNIDRIETLLLRADADLIVLPELSNTGYFFSSRQEVERLAEEVPYGKTTEALCRLAEAGTVYIVAGLIERSGDQCYNATVLVGPAGYMATYRKIHLFSEENLWFNPGDREPDVHDIGLCRVGMMICFDWIFPETSRILCLKGADVICHSANLVLPYCQDAMVTRCLENRIFAITANRTGVETRGGKSLYFTGKSQITGPDGLILNRANQESEEVGVVEINIEKAREKSINIYNDLLKDRRTDCYEALLKRMVIE